MKYQTDQKYAKTINNEPEKYLYKRGLDKIDEYAKEKFHLRIRRRINRNTCFCTKRGDDDLLLYKLLEGKFKGIIYKYGKVKICN